MKREKITVEVAERRLPQHQERGFHVDTRLLQEITKPGQLFLVELETEKEFLDLVWQANDRTRPLAPCGQPRTLLDCARRLAAFDWSFEVLVYAGYPWFQQCLAIDGDYRSDWFGWVAITPLIPAERSETPRGSYYIYDGVHKSIVLAKRLLRKQTGYQPLEVLLLEPRRR
ncbi:MAG: hypothetical protein EHM61_10635 [Acidobacteria bacterium]|nr:MAG: hypothetical protein EHM61_10635 [Acidobacteriota bacterium]